MSTEPSLTLKLERDKSVRQRHPWVFSGAVAAVSGGTQAGDTVAVNCWLEPLFTVAEVGDTATVIGEGDAATVTAALADFVASAALLAVTVTELPEGTAAGAV